MANSQIRGPVEFTDKVTFLGGANLSTEDVGNSNFKSSANERLDATKAVHQFAIGRQLTAPGSAITAKTELLYIVRGSAGVIVGFEAAVTTKATGTDRTATIDLQKSTAGGAFATILSAPISFDDDSTARVAVAAVVSSAALVDGDILQAVVAVAGGDGAQAEGLLVTLTMREQPTP